jgi:DNA-binding NtrC family response regulator
MGDSVDVLLVDDDASVRLLCRVNLELEGFAVREAATIREADAAVAATRPAAVLLDVHLGGEDSSELLGRLRAAGIPVCIVTGSVDVAEYRARADAVLEKPFQPSKMIEIARRLARVEG